MERFIATPYSPYTLISHIHNALRGLRAGKWSELSFHPRQLHPASQLSRFFASLFTKLELGGFYCPSACQCMQSAIVFNKFCLSVRPSNAGTVSKRMDISATPFDILVASFWFSEPYIPSGTPSTGALNVRGWENLANIAIYLENCTRLD